MKKRHVLILIFTVIFAAVSAAGCSANTPSINLDDAVKVTFYLEGGSYQNSSEPLIYYYGFKKGTTNLIKDPAAEDEADRLTPSTVERSEYVFMGWYRNRIETVVDGETKVDYSGQWDFERDKVTDEGITLYAKWSKLIHYTYQLYYYAKDGKPVAPGEEDETCELVALGSPYEVEEGEKFDDYLKYADRFSGYTKIDLVDEAGEPWDAQFKHPGGENHTEIKVIARFERGEFVDVYTAEELIANYNKDIRLMADIDFGGKEFVGFGNYRKVFKGNNHTISNFKLNYPRRNTDLVEDDDLGGRNVLNISLFGRANDAIVSDVTFSGVQIEVDTILSLVRHINVAPICAKATISSFTNVSVTATYTLNRLPSGFDRSELTVVTDRGYFVKDSASVFDNITVNITDNIVNAQ